MPRKTIILQSEFPYHVTNRLMDRQFFGIPISSVWEACEKYLFEIAIRYGVKIHAFVLMGNHFHLLLTTPDSNISDAMMYFQSRVARHISILKGSDSVRFQSRYRWSIVNTNYYFLNVEAYIYLNPVRAHLVAQPEEYKYSTLHGIEGFAKLKIPVCSTFVSSKKANLETHYSLSAFKSSVAFSFPDKISKALKSSFFKL